MNKNVLILIIDHSRNGGWSLNKKKMISKKLKEKHKKLKMVKDFFLVNKMVKDEMSNVGEINQLRNRIGQ